MVRRLKHLKISILIYLTHALLLSGFFSKAKNIKHMDADEITETYFLNITKVTLKIHAFVVFWASDAK
jgi:hypothetical protein